MLHPCEFHVLMVGSRVTDWNELEEVHRVHRFTSCVHTSSNHGQSWILGLLLLQVGRIIFSGLGRSRGWLQERRLMLINLCLSLLFGFSVFDYLRLHVLLLGKACLPYGTEVHVHVYIAISLKSIRVTLFPVCSTCCMPTATRGRTQPSSTSGTLSTTSRRTPRENFLVGGCGHNSPLSI
jgi:hypothetical protein